MLKEIFCNIPNNSVKLFDKIL